MSQHYDKVWTFRTRRFCVELSCTEEVDPDLSWDEDGSVRADLDAGNLYNFTFRVRVLLDGREAGADYLGNSIYADPADFRDHFGMRTKGHGSYFSGMVREAIRQARGAVRDVPKMRI